MTVGKDLKEARERAELSAEQVGERTTGPDIHVLDVSEHGDPLASFATERDLQPHVSIQVPRHVAREHVADERMAMALTLVALLGAAGLGMYLFKTTPFLERKTSAPSASAAPSRDRPVPYTESELPPAIPTRTLASNVTGSWSLATQVESSSYSRFKGLKLGYEMKLQQNGERVTGVGRKVTENGTGIGRQAQTPVTVSGTIEGDRLMLNFVERGRRRRTQGRFVLLVDESGTLRGSFSSSAARSSGRVEARRLSTQ